MSAPARARWASTPLVLAGIAAVSVGWADPMPPSAEAARRPAHVYKSRTQRAAESKLQPEGPPSVFGKSSRAVYYGGAVISNVKVVPVFWTSGVAATTQSQIGSFLTAITASPYLDWLEEYDTIGLLGVDGFAGSKQHIGRGTATAPVTITPTDTATSLTDTDIEAELAAQITSGALPAPTTDGKGHVNTLYMIEFPDSYSINLDGHLSCSYFCGYHYTLMYGTMAVPYAVMPGIGGCGGCGSGFGWVTSIHSHELVEAITDTEVGFAAGTTEGRPLAWYDPTDTAIGMELADICDPFTPAPGVKGGTTTIAGYTVQLIWSNFASACVAEIPICDGSTTQPSCRPCTSYDDHVGCSGATPVCQTSATATNAGECVTCVDDSTCAAPTPRCDTRTNLCVVCLSSIDCSGATPVCDAKTSACRACVSSADCDNGQVCDTSTDADEGRCVDCNTNSDCTFGACDAATHTCSSPPGNAADAGHDAGHDAAGREGGKKTKADAGTPPAPQPASGCGCRVGTPVADGWGAFGFLVAAGVAVGRRRRA